jgi:phosphoglycerol transferase MdoB-like AlkP superfamily enzyme
MHANKGNFWNRENMHQKLGYDKFYNYTGSYKINNDQVIGLGLNDKEFFKQSTDIMTKIDNKHENWYGVLLMLTNHTPFKGITDSDLDLTYKHTITNEDGESEEVINNYLTDTILGNYFVSSHYSDAAIGEFIEHLDEAGLLDNTIVIIYGDHDAKIKRSEFNYYYNYNPETDSRYGTDDPNYKEFTKNDYELNRSVPFIIWTKDNKEKKKIDTVMGMYDVLPTLGNMIGIRSPYALGHDIFSINENFVIFPNGNWITNKMYYNSQNDEGILLDENAVITADYISKITERAERAITASNDIIVQDLNKKMRESNAIIKGD